MQVKVKSILKYILSRQSALIWFALTLLAIGIITTFGPAEHSLGTNIRIVYLHGAWVWASLASFMASGLLGGLGLITKRISLHGWSGAFGRTGLVFWITYLPLSLWAMQSNWNGLYLAEPRWRLALAVAISGLLLQIGLTLENKPILTSSLNLGFLVLVIFALVQTPNVMHPGSPILSSEAWRIQLFFFGLFSLTLLAAWQMARWWYKGEPDTIRK